MKQFNLDEYLKFPSRKIVTRDGREARILCTDGEASYAIVAFIEGKSEENEIPDAFTRHGHWNMYVKEHPNDLFFAL